MIMTARWCTIAASVIVMLASGCGQTVLDHRGHFWRENGPEVIFNGIPGKGTPVLLQFDYNSTALTSTVRQFLDNLATIMTDHPAMLVTVIGHTGDIGSREDNIRLSRARAEAAMTYLIDTHGIARARLQADGWGPDHLLIPGSPTDERNWRVTVYRHHPANKD